MKVVISRFYGTFATKGTWIIFDGEDILYQCKTLELRNLQNQHDISCIPEGMYMVKKTTEYKHYIKPVFHVLDVPGRTDILIHSGNFVSGKKVDSRGCILVGLSFADINKDGFIDIAESTKAMDTLRMLLPDFFTLHII